MDATKSSGSGQQQTRPTRITQARDSGHGSGFAAGKITSQVQSVLDQQIVSGAQAITNFANAMRRAVDEVEQESPQVSVSCGEPAERVE
jgi:hypothetical protein